MWQKVAKLSEVPEGQSKIVNVDGREIALFNVGGSVYALDNTCPHQGGPLGEGYLDGSEVTCPWHAWTFDVKTGDCSTTPGVKQPTFRAKVEGEDVSLDLSS